MYTQSQASPTASGNAAFSNVHTTGGATAAGEADERVSLAPLSPEEALRALLNAPRPSGEGHA